MDVKPINDSVKALCIVYIQIAFQILAAFLSALPSNFPAKAEESSRLNFVHVSVGCCPDVFVWHQENKNASSKSQRDVSLLKKK